jgi:hypothetical protein
MILFFIKNQPFSKSKLTATEGKTGRKNSPTLVEMLMKTSFFHPEQTYS